MILYINNDNEGDQGLKDKLNDHSSAEIEVMFIVFEICKEKKCSFNCPLIN